MPRRQEEDRPRDADATDEYRAVEETPPKPAPPARVAKRPSGAHKTSVLGDFRLVARLGQGGMGTVYRARQISQPRDVAVKVLSKELVGHPGFVQRFQREARLMARLSHAHIIRCYAVGEAHGYHYLAMEYAGGGSVQSWLDRLGRFEVGDALHIALACARALGYAHQHGLVHRDIKPDNLLLTSEGAVKLGDLGLAKASDDNVSLTQTGVGIGTPLYAPPEQISNAKLADARSDLYALGSVLYHMLAGQPPFEGSDFLAVIQAKERGVFTPIRRHRPDVPEEIGRILGLLLARLPEQRFQGCDELIENLQWAKRDNPALRFFAMGASS